ncbi:hypothetical protein K458DRAFT_202180 [Lentithecium fluviatile CBS 122367]|uniref:Uncharacterized protein n=1 Tax=Lentithecium fluviatile CBS 122367 TaxID=1168545 RepID=A0A6G1J888_9PLEO|nr:hypothetical protein K458DRAFT_202180 [Lentithecium fluviatile CBS 122367]
MPAAGASLHSFAFSQVEGDWRHFDWNDRMGIVVKDDDQWVGLSCRMRNLNASHSFENMHYNVMPFESDLMWVMWRFKTALRSRYQSSCTYVLQMRFCRSRLYPLHILFLFLAFLLSLPTLHISPSALPSTSPNDFLSDSSRVAPSTQPPHSGTRVSRTRGL